MIIVVLLELALDVINLMMKTNRRKRLPKLFRDLLGSRGNGFGGQTEDFGLSL